MGFLVRPLHEFGMYRWKGASVVKITNNRSGGTGFRVKAPSGETYILTNKHICNIAGKDGKMTATTLWGEKHTIEVIEKYTKHDLCIMSDIPSLPAISVGSELHWKESIYLIGHPALRPLTLERGHYIGNMDINVMGICSDTDLKKKEADLKILSREMEKYCTKGKNYNEDVCIDLSMKYISKYLELMMGYCTNRFNTDHISAIAYGGNSGSPVLSKWGNLVGVLFAGSRMQPTASYMVPVRFVQDFLKDK